MSFTKTKYDSCFLTQHEQSNKSIFSYVVDDSMYRNKNECNDYTPPFLTYIPSGVQERNINIDSDLRGMTKPYTKCVACKYTPEHYVNERSIQNQHNKAECTKPQMILPDGYTNVSSRTMKN